VSTHPAGKYYQMFMADGKSGREMTVVLRLSTSYDSPRSLPQSLSFLDAGSFSVPVDPGGLTSRKPRLVIPDFRVSAKTGRAPARSGPFFSLSPEGSFDFRLVLDVQGGKSCLNLEVLVDVCFFPSESLQELTRSDSSHISRAG